MQSYLYASCYCEENIWHLCMHPQFAQKQRKVIWISSEAGICPLWHQRAASSPLHPVWWDYHVVLLVKDGQWQVWDLDTTLALPTPASRYLTATFKDTHAIAPLFRVMDADYYQREFSSDRSHMLKDSQWLATPPSWQPIQPHASTFDQMLDFSSDTHGEIKTLTQLSTLVS